VAILNNVLGLDLGGHTVKAVEVAQGLRTLEAVQVCQVLRGDDEVPDLVRHLLEVHRLSTERVVTAVRADRTSIRQLAFPFGEKRRLQQAVPFEVEDMLPFELEDVVLDWERVGGDRTHARVVAAVAPRSVVSELIAGLHEAGCDPRIIEAEGLALANLTAAFDLPGTRLLVDLGHRKTTFCALADGRPLAARAIGVAGRALTEAIAQERALDLADAERVKIEEGLIDGVLGAPPPKVDAVLDQIANEIVRLVAGLEDLTPTPIAELTLCGGTALADRIDELLAERTGIPTARLGLPREEGGIGIVAGGSPVLFAPTIALALRGTARATTEINFRQDEFARRVDLSRYRREFGPTAILAAIVLVLGLISMGTNTYLEARRAGRVETQIAALYAGAFPGQPVPENPVAALRQAVGQANERAEFLGVYRGNLSALDLLTEISRHVPKDLDVAFEELSIDRQVIRIKVVAKTFEAADRLGTELAKAGPFADARIGAIETDKRSGSKKFTVTISLAAREDQP
jgi:type IV pilus assembly protein PilM